MTAARRCVKCPDTDGQAFPEPPVPPFAVRFSEIVIGEFTAACEEIARSGTLTLGPRTARFEALVADLAGTANAVAVTSGTTALELAFEGLGLKNDLVLIPANTSPATAALGEAQLNHRDEWLKGQTAVFDRYRAALHRVSFATVLEVPDGGRASGYKFIALAATPETREELRAHLTRSGVSLAGGVYESLLHDDPRFRPHAAPGPGLFPDAQDFAARHFCLPAWPGLTRQEQDRVTAALGSFRPSP
jgi:dTDP-4-amino-4,6-dideoxygalactose transaminase